MAAGDGGGAETDETVTDDPSAVALASDAAAARLRDEWSRLAELDPLCPGMPVDPASVLSPLDLSHTSSTWATTSSTPAWTTLVRICSLPRTPTLDTH